MIVKIKIVIDFTAYAIYFAHRVLGGVTRGEVTIIIIKSWPEEVAQPLEAERGSPYPRS